jgi:hypothetical protein
MEFKELKSGDNIKDILKEAFDMELPVSGEWGYSKDKPLIIEKNSSFSVTQIEYIFASMRATLEMSLTQPKESRYGGINLKELSRQKSGEFDRVVYEITAIKEDIYAKLIKEYKDGYGKSDFDIDAHFKKREQNSIKREVEYWFKLN